MADTAEKCSSRWPSPEPHWGHTMVSGAATRDGPAQMQGDAGLVSAVTTGCPTAEQAARLQVKEGTAWEQPKCPEGLVGWVALVRHSWLSQAPLRGTLLL